MSEFIHDADIRSRALDPQTSFIVEAPAGSGKTELLTRRFLNLLKYNANNPEEIVAITFTRKAAAEMRERIVKNSTVDPKRLRIMTIDAFCGYIVSRMPLKFRHSVNLNITESPEELYEKAVQNILLFCDSPALSQLLLHVDNDVLRLTSLCIEMLSRRDQWLPHVFGLDAIEELEQTLKKSRDYLFEKAKNLLPEKCRNLEGNPADIFLTQKREWRKKAPFIDELIHNDELLQALIDSSYAPAENYSSEQRQLIQALSELLPLLVAELQLVFREENTVDFIEINLRALQAFGTEDAPTDIALYFDYQLRHLLIDEFQDTSLTQLSLIEKLVAGWETGDGRTLFLVGDPMQSIYRFRKADVGIFLKAQKSGIGHIKLESLRLSSNFRTVDKIVDWVNNSFKNAKPSTAIKKHGEKDKKSVFYHDNSLEDEKVIEIIKENPDKHIGLLVRSRSHLKNILDKLHVENIPYRAVDIAFLDDNMLIEDLFSLTRALLDPTDKIAWLALLRGPWFGLNLEELLAISADDIIVPPQNNAIDWARENYRRLSLRDWVEQTWIKLEGPGLLQTSQELEYAKAYFDLLDKVQDIELIEKKLATLALPTNPDPSIKLEIMTIHKSKGLEFDIVILPGLGRSSRSDSTKLVLWAERMNQSGKPELLVAPLKHAAEQDNSIYQYLKYEEGKLNRAELQRLLYVAVTRAKEQLHLLLPKLSEENPCLDIMDLTKW